MDVRAVVAWNLRKLRVEREVSQEKLAVDAKLDRTYVSRLERGLENPTVLVIRRLARALSATAVDFFIIPDPNAPKPVAMRRGRKPRE